jgi:DnaK suppressor protein
MDGNTLQKLRDDLLKRRHDIGVDLQRTMAEDIELNANQAEMIDIAQALEQLDRDSSIADQERRELIEIEKALAKMATGAFGNCEDCGDEIPPKRLMIVPQARLCAGCQAFEERQQGRARGLSNAAAR